MFEPVLAQFCVGKTTDWSKNIYSKRQNSAYYCSGKTGADKIETDLDRCQEPQKIRNIVNSKILKNGKVGRLNTVVKKSISLAGALSAVLLTLINPVNSASAEESKKKSFHLFPSRKIAQTIRPANVSPSGEKVIAMPGEAHFFPTNPDGTPFVLDIDTTVNFTDSLNRFYYDPKWRGEVWVPFNQWTISERASRLMATWPEYDEFSQLRKLNHVHKFFERYSGFGP